MKKSILKSLLILCSLLSTITSYGIEPIKIGSKKFTESVILGEIATQIIRQDEHNVEHMRELGGTRILWNALMNGNIDIYPEYTGTIIQEILANENIPSDTLLPTILSHYKIIMSRPLGFNNTYSFGIKQDLARSLSISRISDLINHPNLNFGFTNEFMSRKDGWPTIRQVYKLPQTNVNGIDHDLAYRGLQGGSIDLIDLYSTDPEIDYYDLFILEDDLSFFTDYQAVYLIRSDLLKRSNKAVKLLLTLEGRFSEEKMIKMNAKVKIKQLSEAKVASQFLMEEFLIKTKPKKITFMGRLFRTTKEHLMLVFISLSLAILLSIPLGILSYFYKKIGQFILGTAGIIQTIPSLALLVFMIPLLGIGAGPAICALFLYSLLPIIRNTYTGLKNISIPIRESAEALGLPRLTQLRLIDLPLASRSIMAGIKISAIINIGTATLGALIGAGGYGQPILTGIRLDNIGLILEGAIPAALLALLAQGIFDLFDKILVPKGLRQ
jgi:osmoprotectant transport system permease protein